MTELRININDNLIQVVLLAEEYSKEELQMIQDNISNGSINDIEELNDFIYENFKVFGIEVKNTYEIYL